MDRLRTDCIHAKRRTWKIPHASGAHDLFRPIKIHVVHCSLLPQFSASEATDACWFDLTLRANLTSHSIRELEKMKAAYLARRFMPRAVGCRLRVSETRGKKRKKKKTNLGMNMEKSACVDDTKPRLPRRIWVLEVSIHHSQAQNLSTLTDWPCAISHRWLRGLHHCWLVLTKTKRKKNVTSRSWFVRYPRLNWSWQGNPELTRWMDEWGGVEKMRMEAAL